MCDALFMNDINDINYMSVTNHYGDIKLYWVIISNINSNDTKLSDTKLY